VVAVGGGGNLQAAIPTSLGAVDKAKPLWQSSAATPFSARAKKVAFHEFRAGELFPLLAEQ